MEKPKKTGLMSFGKHLISTVSVSLVLFLLGIVGLLGVAASNISDSIRENMGFSVIMADNASASDINDLKQQFSRAPYLSSYDYLSAEDILQQEEQLAGIDISDALGVNPYSPEFNVHVKAQYASSDSINAIAEPIRTLACVDEVVVHAQMVDEVNTSLRNLSLVFIAIAGALLVISFVLINNTVRLTIYSRRFLLHTMQLVGATAGFIRRPIVVGNILNGLLAAALSIAMLSVLRIYIPNLIPDADPVLPWTDMLPVFGAIIVGGIIICGLASYLATNKYLRQSYDDMFR